MSKKQDFTDADAKAIVDNVLKGKYVSYFTESDEYGNIFIVFEPHDWKHDMAGQEADDYFVEIH